MIGVNVGSSTATAPSIAHACLVLLSMPERCSKGCLTSSTLSSLRSKSSSPRRTSTYCGIRKTLLLEFFSEAPSEEGN